MYTIGEEDMKYDFTTIMERSGRDAIAAEVIPYDGVTVKEGFSRLPMWASSGRMEDRSTDLMQSA